MPDHIIEKLQARRVALGMTYRALARRSGVAYPNCCNILTGKKPPTLATVKKLADALGVKITTR